jgi:hypothetical protein
MTQDKGCTRGLPFEGKRYVHSVQRNNHNLCGARPFGSRDGLNTIILYFLFETDADDMSQDLDDEEDWELEDDEDEDQITNEDPTRQLDVDICPPNLDQKAYDDIVALREKRLDLGTKIPFLSFYIKHLFCF